MYIYPHLFFLIAFCQSPTTMTDSNSDVRRSVVWLDLERRYLGPPKGSSVRPRTLASMTASTTTDLESPTSSRYSTSFYGSGATEREIAKSPLPWFDLRSEGSVAGTEKDEERTSAHGGSQGYHEEIFDAYFVGPDPEQSVSSRSMGS